ncbi:30S ribosomal protein S15 [Deinococcus roseus]|uniref:Small ribosomal subunit protein uS15 n=1 Tax=Deinococcus roseus TaxID=392414 RepID=A0ABQ2D4C0_9DEIO|nr:30S ribosomal protein S15 [Deinococcus roseus]GGJ45794.1 30S ribosomal protein S15 [Deinococcus roseus]
MSINKTEVIQQYATKEGDTGSTAVQIAILTARINNLSGHLNVNQKDKHGQRGLQMMVGQRRRLLRYLERSDFNGYIELTDKLGIRRGHTQVK